MFFPFIDVPDGKIIGLALRKQLFRRGNVNYAMFYEIFENFAFGKVTGNSGVRDVRLHDAWAFIMRKGQLQGNDENINKYTSKHYSNTYAGRKLRGFEIQC